MCSQCAVTGSRSQRPAPLHRPQLHPAEGALLPLACTPSCPCGCSRQHRWAAPHALARGSRRNTWHAQCLRLSAGDQVTVSPFQPPRDGFGAALLSLELGYVSKRASPAEYDAKTLAKHILTRYVGQVCCRRLIAGRCKYPFSIRCRSSASPSRGAAVLHERAAILVRCTTDHCNVVSIAVGSGPLPQRLHRHCCRRCFRWIRSW